ncbi:MAG: response regulator, partial [Pseudomonadota bacterium]
LTKSPLEGKQKHFAQTILRSAQTLLDTINDILDFSKIEAGRLDLDSAPFDLRLLVEDVVQQLGTMAHRKRLELICDVAFDVPTAIRGDAQRLRQVLVNLVGNAIKFTDQGQVTLKVRTPPDGERGALLFEVIDTGIGIGADAQARIFDSFAQADGSTSRQFGGTGLGLAISQRLVALMGGRIRVESKPGKGATFRFTARFALDNAPSSINSPTEALYNLRVLILDDNDTNRDVLHRQLEAWYVPHDCAADGQTALEHLRRARIEEYPYSVVLVDRFMPAMDGIDFARLLREDDELAATQLVLLSSMTTDKTSAAWREAAFTCSLTKPLRQADLYQCLRSLDQGDDACAVAEDVEELTVLPETRFPASILVAEDHAVNQDLIQEALSQLGCETDLVEDGAAAIRAFEHGGHDLILMDCQMPHVDGFQATRAIRDLERRNGDPDHIPIVALTANAMEGDRDRCLAAGMNDYLTKPFMQADLIAVLLRWLPDGKSPSADERAVAESTPTPAEASVDADTSGVIDPAALDRIREMAGSKGDGLLTKVIGRYLEKTPELMADLTAAAQRSDYDQVRQIAHSLKSSSANLGAVSLSEQCKEVETACRAGEVDQVDATVEKIVADYEQVALTLDVQRGRIEAGPTAAWPQSAALH